MVNRVRGPTPRPQLRQTRTKRSKAPRPGADGAHVDSGHQDMGDMETGDSADDGDNDGQQKGHHRGIIAARGRKTSIAGVREDVAATEAEAESGAATARGITRKGMGGGLGDSGFQQREHAREAYESKMRGHVENDAERFAALREGGAVDSFNPELLPRDVEKLGQMSAANHMVRMFDHWVLQGLDRKACIETAASWLVEFDRNDNIRKVLTELESRPIRDVYPLELLIELVRSEPEKVPDISERPLLSDQDALNGKKPVFEGHAIYIPVPKDVRLKSFALLGGARPGYEFFPSAVKTECYELLIDTAGTWRFALLGVRTKSLGGGKIIKEENEGILDVFTVEVVQMGRKGEVRGHLVDHESRAVPEDRAADGTRIPTSEIDLEALEAKREPAEKSKAQRTEDIMKQAVARRKETHAQTSPGGLNRSALSRSQSGEDKVVVPALSKQVAAMIREGIVKDPAQRNQAQTYTLDVTFFVPGDYASEYDRNELFHLAVENAAPFDEVWAQAAEAIEKMLAEHEPAARPPSVEDMRRALRRARVAQ